MIPVTTLDCCMGRARVLTLYIPFLRFGQLIARWNNLICMGTNSTLQVVALKEGQG